MAMQTFRVELGPASHPVHIGAGILDQLGRLAKDAGINPGRVALITDSNVERLYASRAVLALKEAGFAPETIAIPAGEASKSAAMLDEIYDRMTAAEIDRAGAVFALGGGVVGDLAGFAAATYLRGIATVQVPTTMVAQVDSSLGGKTGINHPRAKNLIGAFHQPRAIVADVATLATLPDREFREGLAEVIKYGAIMDAAMIADLERDIERILSRESAFLEAVVTRSLRHKAAVVAADEREGGLRKILNFGHTAGHALEASAGYGSYLHGEAVAIGMAVATALSEKHGGLSADEGSRLVRLIGKAGLPTEMPPGARTAEFVSALRLDKKRSENAVEFIVLERLGKATTKRLGFEQILSAIA
ncbi:MAG TPA: 3-dehydroquinate synthase [Candidatus Binataceae bacterium]|nr:3-dehydroquinate synthase [Candidatus Binataceae bacterium]